MMGSENHERVRRKVTKRSRIADSVVTPHSEAPQSLAQRGTITMMEDHQGGMGACNVEWRRDTG